MAGHADLRAIEDAREADMAVEVVNESGVQVREEDLLALAHSVPVSYTHLTLPTKA